MKNKLLIYSTVLFITLLAAFALFGFEKADKIENLSFSGREEMKDMDVENKFKDLRSELVQTLILEGIKDEMVLEAISKVPRHKFIPNDQKSAAYENRALPIGEGQTISQPYIVALMTELADVKEDSKVLEIGTGSGYQAAILSVIAKDVYSIEYIEVLGLRAKDKLNELGYSNVFVKIGDGYKGWPEFGPFDSIIVTAAIDHIPEPLIEQLARGGKMVIPVKNNYFSEDLMVIEKSLDGTISSRSTIPVRFVPFLGPNSKAEH